MCPLVCGGPAPPGRSGPSEYPDHQTSSMQGEGGAHVMVISSGQYNITTLTQLFAQTEYIYYTQYTHYFNSNIHKMKQGPEPIPEILNQYWQ